MVGTPRKNKKTEKILKKAKKTEKKNLKIKTEISSGKNVINLFLKRDVEFWIQSKKNFKYFLDELNRINWKKLDLFNKLGQY